jgi:hypothetical protein
VLASGETTSVLIQLKEKPITNLVSTEKIAEEKIEVSLLPPVAVISDSRSPDISTVEVVIYTAVAMIVIQMIFSMWISKRWTKIHNTQKAPQVEDPQTTSLPMVTNNPVRQDKEEEMVINVPNPSMQHHDLSAQQAPQSQTLQSLDIRDIFKAAGVRSCR